ncbi:hypothetical protein ES708_24318 [subsurface metagenome]
MGKASKIVKCAECGGDFPRKELNRNFHCQDCRMKVLRETMEQLHRKEGPRYEKWKQGMKAAAGRL